MSNLPVGDKGFEWPDEKASPGKRGVPPGKGEGRPSNMLGSGNHDHNWQGRSTNTEGSDYHSPDRATSGLHGNFEQKDASIAYLRERGKQGQEIHHTSGTNQQNKIKTGNIGVTAYNSNPVNEVFKPATSQDAPKPDPIIYRTIKKTNLNK